MTEPNGRFVNTILNLQVSQEGRNFVTGQSTIRFSKITLLDEVNKNVLTLLYEGKEQKLATSQFCTNEINSLVGHSQTQCEF
jgi:hypothetical protein